MTDPGGPIIRRPGEGTTIEGPVSGPLTFKARGEQTNGTFTAAFAKIGDPLGMNVIGPPLAQSDPQ